MRFPMRGMWMRGASLVVGLILPTVGAFGASSCTSSARDGCARKGQGVECQSNHPAEVITRCFEQIAEHPSRAPNLYQRIQLVCEENGDYLDAWCEQALRWGPVRDFEKNYVALICYFAQKGEESGRRYLETVIISSRNQSESLFHVLSREHPKDSDWSAIWKELSIGFSVKNGVHWQLEFTR